MTGNQPTDRQPHAAAAAAAAAAAVAVAEAAQLSSINEGVNLGCTCDTHAVGTYNTLTSSETLSKQIINALLLKIRL